MENIYLEFEGEEKRACLVELVAEVGAGCRMKQPSSFVRW